MLISADEFREIWQAKSATDGSLMAIEEARSYVDDHIWTVVEPGDDRDGNWYAIPGFHSVNQLGCVVTMRPWVDCMQDAIYLSTT